MHEVATLEFSLFILAFLGHSSSPTEEGDHSSLRLARSLAWIALFELRVALGWRILLLAALERILFRITSPVSSWTTSGAVVGTASSDATKTSSRPFDREALRTFIRYANIYSIKSNGFSSSDLPPADTKQPAWKPYLYKGKQRILFTIFETINAAMYDRDEIPNSLSVSGQINCRAELEGMPDVSLPLTGLSSDHIESLSFHHSAQVPEQGTGKKSVMFSPSLGNFISLRYQGSCNLVPPIKGFYQLSIVSADGGAFSFRLNLMENYKSPLTMEFCTVTMSFPRRRVISVNGSPSLGSISTSEHAVEWKIVVSG